MDALKFRKGFDIAGASVTSCAVVKPTVDKRHVNMQGMDLSNWHAFNNAVVGGPASSIRSLMTILLERTSSAEEQIGILPLPLILYQADFGLQAMQASCRHQEDVLLRISGLLLWQQGDYEFAQRACLVKRQVSVRAEIDPYGFRLVVRVVAHSLKIGGGPCVLGLEQCNDIDIFAVAAKQVFRGWTGDIF